MSPPRLALAHTPTPIIRGRLPIGGSDVALYIKRDDITGGPEAGNKIRKLEYLLADAQARGADTLVTCGGIQSNHARATAIVGAQLGMKSVLLLRTTGPDLDPKNAPFSGNVFLDKLVDATIRLITPAQYRERSALLAETAEALGREGKRPYVIPEGGSNGLGAFGYVRCMREVRQQLDLGLAGDGNFDIVFHACGSGGTAAGVALGAALYDVAKEVRAIAVCDDAPTFERVIHRIIDEARGIDPSLPASPARLIVDDTAKGPAYAVASDAQKAFIIEVARKSGLLFDPVYTGKALFAIREAAARGELDGKRVLFIHTGGLPGLLAQAEDFRGLI